MSTRDNYLKAIRFESPEYIPMGFHINAACWHHYPHDALMELMASHTHLFPDFDANKCATPSYGPNQRAGEPFVDDWGCTWQTTDDGITGTVTTHPLADWDALDSYIPPSPATQSGLGPRDWNTVADEMDRAKLGGELLMGGLNHGHTFLLLCDLRGYQNVLFDMVDDDPRLHKLIEMIEEFIASIRALTFSSGTPGYNP